MSDFLSFQLTDDFIEPYSALKPDWGFPIGGGNFLSELVYVNKYSALKDDGSKEQWYETCRRCVEGMYSILKDHCKKNKTPWNDLKAQKSARDAYDRMFHFKWTPPGRGLQHMGREAIHSRQDSSFLQNCFAGTEELITLTGPQAFQDLVDEELAVWTTNGWQSAVVQSFGVQEVQRVTFKPNGIRSLALRDVVVTPDHRWILSDGTETTKLKVGDVVKQSVVPGGEYMEDYHQGMVHGLIFGDGGQTSYQYADGRHGYELRCCDARTQELANHPELKNIWDKIYKDRPSGDGDWFFFVKSQDLLKEFPVGKSHDYLRGFMNGWIGSDAWIAPEGSYKLDSQRSDSYEWLQRHAASAGYQLVGYHQDNAATNFGDRKAPLNRFTLRDYKNTIPWRVVSIVPLDETEVFCAVVPNTASFALSSGIYTGNCAFLTTAKLSAHSVWEATGPFTRMMEMSMCVDGDTWVMTTEGPRKIKEIDMPLDVYVSGEKHAAPYGAWATGIKDTVLLETEEGYSMRLTNDHRVRTVTYGRTTNNRVTESFAWVEAGKLKSGDKILLSDQYGINWLGEGTWDEGYLTGACLGDGWKNTTSFVVAAYKKDIAYESIKTQALSSVASVSRRALAGGWTEKNKDCDTLTIGTWVSKYLDVSPKIMLDEIEKASKEFYQGFLRGFFDADGGVVINPKSNSVQVCQSNLDTLQRVQRMLLRLGVKSNIQVKRGESVPMAILGVDTVSNPSWNLVISSDAILRFADVVGFSKGPKADALHTLTQQGFYHSYMSARVRSVVPAGETVTYDISVPSIEAFDANGLYVHNCGIGVGFDTRGANNLALHEPSLEKKDIFIVEDSREGWAEAIGVLLESYFFKNRNYVEFDYTQIRPSGALLKSFGGRASGPQPLIDCIERVRFLLGEREGEKLTSRDIVDVMNLIGKAVVAGGARRSAQIAFGSVDDDDYTSIKDWTLPENQLRTDPDHGWAWNSNNSVFVEGEIPKELIDKTVLNGEPGYMWLDLAQQYGRMVDPPNGADYRAMGGNPCLEQTLEPWECCTLVETFPTKHTDFSDYRETLKAAYLYGKAVTLLPTAWPETNEVMARNRRIGCSMSGDAEFVETRSWAELQEWQDEGYKFINHRDKKYSEWLAVRESIKKTSIKPSGTVSLVAAVTPGVHWPVSAGSHIRRVRYSVNDPLVAKLEDAGYPVEPMIGDPKNTVVVTFITQSAPIRDERSVSIWEKAELAVMAQRWWADNQVSATVTFLPSEEGQIAPLLASKKGQIKGISFLPLRDDEVYPQAPYERISEEDAQKMLSKVKHLKGIYKKGQEASGDKFCDNDSCTI